MNEIGKILESKEKFEWDDKPKLSAYLASMTFATIILLIMLSIYFIFPDIPIFWPIIIISILVFSTTYGLLSYKVTHYAMTNKKVIIQTGVIGRDFKLIDYDKMQNIFVDVGIIGKIFGVGTIKIFTGEIGGSNASNYGEIRIGSSRSSGLQPSYDSLRYISEPYAVLKHLQEHLSERKENLYGGKDVVRPVKVVK